MISKCKNTIYFLFAETFFKIINEISKRLLSLQIIKLVIYEL